VAKTKEKIILVCKESYTYPMHFLRRNLLDRGFEVDVIFIHVTESILKDHSYVSFCEMNPDAHIYTFDDSVKEYWATYKNAAKLIDYEYLNSIEKKYCKDLPIGLLMMSEQCFTTPYHYRFYFRDLTEDEKLYWIQLLFKSIEDIVETSNPSRILDIDNAVIGRTILFQVAKKNNILYTTLESSKYKSVWLPTYTLGRETDKYFIDSYNSLMSSGEIQKKYVNAVHEFREQKSIILPDFKFNNTVKVLSIPLLKDLKKIARQVVQLIKDWARNYKFSGFVRRRPLIASYAYSIVYFIVWFFRERYLLSETSNFFEDPKAGEKYVYFPLHLIPESTTLLKSPFYPNELFVIEAIAKALPLGWKLYVKEHGAMIGERPLTFYKQIKRLSNVRLCRLDSFQDPKDWITNSVGVITLSGTSAFEAAMLGKKALMFGNSYFEVLDGIQKINSFSELPEKIKMMESNMDDNILSCAVYIQLVEELGLYIPLLEILTITGESINKKVEVSDDINAHINRLSDLLLKRL
jgi:hypothetical protein